MQNTNGSLFSNIELLPIIFVIALLLIIFLFPHNENEDNNELNNRDKLYILAITLTYAFISLWKLGTISFPSTTWQPAGDNQNILLELKEESSFSRILLIYGEGDNNSNPDAFQLGINEVVISGSNDNNGPFEEITRFNSGSIYQYIEYKGDYDYKYIKLESTSKNNTISEVGFYNDSLNKFLDVAIVEDEFQNSKYPATLIIDEQEKLVVDPTYEHQSYFDEIYHARNAYEVANGQYMYYSVHPLLGTNIMALFIKLFGLSPFTWRLAGALFGIMMVPLFYLILHLLFHNTNISLLGTTIFSFDFMHITTSRIATLEPFSIFFILLMFYFMLKYYLSSFYEIPLNTQLKYLLLCGISTGLGIATKWTACYAAVGLAVLLFTNLFKRYKEYLDAKKEKKKRNEYIIKTFPRAFLQTIIWCFVFFIFIPVIIYWVSFLPDHISRSPYSIKQIWDHNIYMYNYHATLEATHPFQSTWYQWLLDIRPTWYYFKNYENAHTIACFSHPLLTWLGLPSIIYVFYNAIFKKDKKAWFITVGYLANLLPWVSFVSRCIFSYHFYPTSLFTAMAIAYAAYLLKIHNNKKLLYAIITIYLIIFIIYLPVITGFKTTLDYIHIIEIFKTWSFG